MSITDVQLDVDTKGITFFPDSRKGANIFRLRRITPQQDRPRLVYINNVMQTADGIRSLQSKPFIASAPAGLPQPFQSRRLLFVQSTSGESGYYFTTNAGGATRTHYVYDIDSGVWRTTATVSDANATRLVTQAFINGVSYAFNKNEGLYTFATNFGSLNIQTVQGITVTAMEGMIAAMNYMIAWDINGNIYWSAPDAPLDFRPIVSLINTGAGSLIPQELRGLIVNCYPTAGGFIIYTTTEIIAVRYSGNSQNPWIFNEIKGSDGIAQTQEVVGLGGSIASQFVYTKSGIQEVTLAKATQILPELTDFLASLWQVTSNTDGTFTRAEITGGHKLVVMTFVSNRYLCVSYGNTGFASPTLYQGIWIFDSQLNTFGHIVVSHLSTFDYLDPLTDLDDRVGFLGVWQADGTVDLIRLSAQGGNNTGDTQLVGELVWEEFKLSEGKMVAVNKIELQGDLGYTAPTVGVRTKDTEGVRAAEVAFTESPVGSMNFVQDVTGIAHRIRVSGQFDINEIKVDAVDLGRV